MLYALFIKLFQLCNCISRKASCYEKISVVCRSIDFQSLVKRLLFVAGVVFVVVV